MNPDVDDALLSDGWFGSESRPFADAAEHFAAERARMLGLLAEVLAAQRTRGRTVAADPVRDLVIEEGEAEGLLRVLSGPWPVAAHANGDRRAQAALRRRLDERAERSAESDVALPLRHVRRAFGLTPSQYDATVLALLVETDSRAARLAAFLNDHVGTPRPTLGLVAAIAEVQSIEPGLLSWPEAPVLADGLLTLGGSGPLPGRTLHAELRQALRLANGEVQLEPGVVVHPPTHAALEPLVLGDELRRQVQGWIDAVQQGAAPPAVVVTGPKGSGRSALIRAAAAALGHALVSADATVNDPHEEFRLLRREARWYGGAIAVDLAEADNAGNLWRALGVPPGLVFIECVPAAVPSVLATSPFEPALWRCEMPGVGHRAELWRSLSSAGMSLSAAEANSLASAYHFGPAAIDTVITRATVDSGGGEVTRQHLVAAARDQVGQGLSLLADRLTLTYRRSDLVLAADTEAELDLAVSWVHHQRTVLDTWGLGGRIAGGRGLSALFAGPPGTGKTMAAQVLAHELDLDCYRVDLSRVVSKFIGETEKNLATVFDEAEAGGAVLFFDEADALFGKRSEVRDARDRYANLEVGYLLQRMEDYDGVAVLATNRALDMDEAFLRRFQVVARFRMPVPAERLRIWQGLVPDQCAQDPTLNLERVAEMVELSGGEIKNCVLAAAYLAAASDRSVGNEQIATAVRRELGKSGRLVDEATLAKLVDT